MYLLHIAICSLNMALHMRLSANRATLNSKCTVSLLSLLQCSFWGLYSIIKHTHLSYQVGRPYPQHITIYPHHSSPHVPKFLFPYVNYNPQNPQSFFVQTPWHMPIMPNRIYPVMLTAMVDLLTAGCMPLYSHGSQAHEISCPPFWLLKSDEIP